MEAGLIACFVLYAAVEKRKRDTGRTLLRERGTCTLLAQRLKAKSTALQLFTSSVSLLHNNRTRDTVTRRYTPTRDVAV